MSTVVAPKAEVDEKSTLKSGTSLSVISDSSRERAATAAKDLRKSGVAGAKAAYTAAKKVKAELERAEKESRERYEVLRDCCPPPEDFHLACPANVQEVIRVPKDVAFSGFGEVAKFGSATMSYFLYLLLFSATVSALREQLEIADSTGYIIFDLLFISAPMAHLAIVAYFRFEWSAREVLYYWLLRLGIILDFENPKSYEVHVGAFGTISLSFGRGIIAIWMVVSQFCTFAFCVYHVTDLDQLEWSMVVNVFLQLCLYAAAFRGYIMTMQNLESNLISFNKVLEHANHERTTTQTKILVTEADAIENLEKVGIKHAADVITTDPSEVLKRDAKSKDKEKETKETEIVVHFDDELDEIDSMGIEDLKTILKRYRNEALKARSRKALAISNALVPESMRDVIDKDPDAHENPVRDWLSSCIIIREQQFAWLLLNWIKDIQEHQKKILAEKNAKSKKYRQYLRWFGARDALDVMFGTKVAGLCYICVPEVKWQDDFELPIKMKLSQILYHLRIAKEEDYNWFEVQDVAYAKTFIAYIGSVLNALEHDNEGLTDFSKGMAATKWVIRLFFFIVTIGIFCLIPYGYWNWESYREDE